MNSRNFNQILGLILLGILPLILPACGNARVYEAPTIHLKAPSLDKPNRKSTAQFLSIAWSDLFGSSIPPNELRQWLFAYEAFGDLKLMEEMIIKALISKAKDQIPAGEDMRDNLPEFIRNTYFRFLKRDPLPHEAWELEKMIRDDPGLSPEMIWYAVLTSDEYRKF
jgi:hypothetical protein